MHFILTPLLPLTLTLYRLRADAVPRPIQFNFSDLPTEINDQIFGNTDLVAYVTALGTTGVAPLVTPEVELKLLSGAAEEVKQLNIYDDDQRARLSLILEATRTIVRLRSGLPTTIHLETDANTLKDLAARFEVTFLEYSSLSSSPTWAKLCMAALLGKDTLIKLLPSLSEGFFNSHMRSMLQAAAVVADFETLRAIAEHPGFSSLQSYIKEDALFSGSVDFVRKIVEFVPKFIKNRSVLETAINLNHRSLFNYLYAETIKQDVQQWKLNDGIARALEALAGRGWEDEFKQLYRDHPQLLGTKKCLIAAAKHGRIEILKYLLFDDKKLAEKARPRIKIAFGVAVGFGNIKAINFLLEYEGQNTITPDLIFTQPTPAMLKAVGESGRWDGIEHLMQQRQEGDARFEQFQLGGDASDGVKMACKHGHLQVLEKLLQKNNEQCVFTFKGPHKTFRESLELACQHGHLQVVQELLLKDANGNYVYPGIDMAASGNWALSRACENGHILVVQELLRKDENGHYVHQGIDPAAGDNSALRLACENGHLPVSQELLRKDGNGHYVHQGIDPAARDNWALRFACQNGHVLVVQELLHKDGNGHYVHQGIDPAVWDNWALTNACQNGHFLVVQELLRKYGDGTYFYQGIDPSAWNNGALRTACGNGHLLVVQELLRKNENGHYFHQGINPAARNNAPLIEACEQGHLDIVKLLLQRRPNTCGVIEYEHDGIDAAAQDNMALVRAIEAQQTKIVQFLLQKTEEGEYIFPGIRVTREMRQLAVRMNNPKLNGFAEFLPDTM